MGIREETEQKILDAACAWVAARVQDRLPLGKRGLRAKDPIRERVPAAVLEALEAVAGRIAAEVAEVVPHAPFGIEERNVAGHDGRFKVIENTSPCSICNAVRRVASLEVSGGAVVSVTCEACETDHAE